MLRYEVDEVMKILDRYFILADLKYNYRIAYSYKDQKVKIYDIKDVDFDASLEKEKYGISNHGDSYIITKPEGVLYFYHQCRNYIYNKAGYLSVDALEYMINDFRKFMIKKCDLNISNNAWISMNDKDSNYYEMRTKADNKLKTLLYEFDKIVNPYSEGKINKDDLKNTTMIKPYQDGNSKCVYFEIEDENCIKKYSRRKEGFTYSFISNINNKNVHICHYFIDGIGEGINAVIEGINLRYSLTNDVLELDDVKYKITEDRMYLIYEILMDVIKLNNVELYKKVKMFK